MYPRIHAASAPHRPAFVVADTGEQVTWAELDRRSAALAGWFHARGLRPGDVVLLVMGNDVRFAEVVWACWRSGPVVAPVSPRLGPDELRPMVEDAAPAAVVAEADEVVRPVAFLGGLRPHVDRAAVARAPRLGRPGQGRDRADRRRRGPGAARR
ncbi:AMP-binding protein [Pseudonocardia sp. RS010]|uniref:AMP-binding protein n=1 Tax=Pseudonocardia sp. RS010 TaxID=3385979 RepID=UPI0039A36893